MAQRDRTHLGGDSMEAGSLAPKHLTKQEFGRRVYNLMLKKGWRQADLARASDLPPDSISSYIRGLKSPTALSLQKLAGALGVQPHDLLPNQVEHAIAQDFPSLEMRVSTSDPRRAWLRVNRWVSTSAAAKIVEILNVDDASADRS
ncbi:MULTISPECIES: helix-turn-helix domain-containing protein [unclassified Aurantimonas]|uniref:helix-turn-helix domain-containing protein n=1 Tax=unclassified Aurantimonas TaxID=2638230 RepID=UPI002E1870E5|nr:MULTISPECIES: helix-turn-helix transcriptional regulator [unclassified Aurantimonas]MEC5291546.1 helix-turn-helix transcriptional regulator [Aurantimonas sp. C2-3-R2]MEC5412630.1 helix-turn-helix transcriptional regulator [Aurantimonas sp. C2-4-R8]